MNKMGLGLSLTSVTLYGVICMGSELIKFNMIIACALLIFGAMDNGK